MSSEPLLATPCPNCGNPDGVFHIEQVEHRRPVLGVDKFGTYIIESESELLDEVCTNERFYCCNCFHQWPLPTYLDYI